MRVTQKYSQLWISLLDNQEAGWEWWSVKKIQLTLPSQWHAALGVHRRISCNKVCFHGWSPRVEPQTRSLTKRAPLCISQSRIPKPLCCGKMPLVLIEPSPPLHRMFLSNCLNCLILSAWKAWPLPPHNTILLAKWEQRKETHEIHMSTKIQSPHGALQETPVSYVISLLENREANCDTLRALLWSVRGLPKSKHIVQDTPILNKTYLSSPNNMRKKWSKVKSQSLC